jgi:hypothetical protein
MPDMASPPAAPGFEADIKPLFRASDRDAMRRTCDLQRSTVLTGAARSRRTERRFW